MPFMQRVWNYFAKMCGSLPRGWRDICSFPPTIAAILGHLPLSFTVNGPCFPESRLFLLPSYAESHLVANSSRLYLFGLQMVDLSLSRMGCFMSGICFFKIILAATEALLCNSLWSSGKHFFFRMRVGVFFVGGVLPTLILILKPELVC